MRVAVIGGSGHIGSYLTPLLAEAGLDVVCVSRGLRVPYREDPSWSKVRRVELDRAVEEEAGNFGARIASLMCEVVVDLTCYTPASAVGLAESLRGRVDHFLHCGTIWVHGHSVEVPTSEEERRAPFGEYGIRKAEIETYLLTQARDNGFPATVLHPGHLVGEGWNPINPQGNFDPQVFAAIRRGEEITLPNLGLETVHHVHAADVAHAFLQAIQHRKEALAQSFHVVSPAALTLRGFAEGMFRFFNQPAKLRFLPYEQWRETVSEKNARSTWDHIAHSPNCSIAKARSLLGYSPSYRSLSAVQESVTWMLQNGVIGS